MPFNPGNKRLQNALYGRSTKVPLGVATLPNGKGGSYTVTTGSVTNYGGNMKFGLYPTVGVGLDMLLIVANCCPPGSGATCYNTVSNDTSSGSGRSNCVINMVGSYWS